MVHGSLVLLFLISVESRLAESRLVQPRLASFVLAGADAQPLAPWVWSDVDGNAEACFQRGWGEYGLRGAMGHDVAGMDKREGVAKPTCEF